MSEHTIYALSTAPGQSGVAIIRISGLEAKKALPLFGIQDTLLPRQATYVSFCSPETGEVIDQGLALLFPAPNSFTGETVLEFHTHGSLAVVQAMLKYLSTLEGFRLAAPGEFSKRAFNHGKMDLTQAEGLADLIAAETEMQRKQAVKQFSGVLGDYYESWRRQLLRIYALLEAYIDFPDEDIPADVTEEMHETVDRLMGELQHHLTQDVGERIRNGVTAVILGKPNVGKSSLLNALTKREVAIVSSIAGTTRDVLEAHLDIAGMPLTLIDTAGIREHTEDVIEQEGMRRALARAEQADIALLVTTADDPTPPLIEGHVAATLRIINKIDQTPYKDDVKDAIPLSVTTGEGMEQLVDALEAQLKTLLTLPSDPLYTRARHKEALTETLNALNVFSEAAAQPVELRAESIRLAARHLGGITGTIDVDEVLGEIFSSFCIGK